MSRATEALELLARIREKHSDIVVSFSGGKDSWAILDLCSRAGFNLHAYFCYIVPGLEAESVWVERAERKYGISIHRFPNPALVGFLRAGYYCPRPHTMPRALKHADIYAIIRQRTGANFIAFGHRMDESLQRRGMIKSTEGIDWRLGKTYPLWNWNARAVYAYLRTRKIEYPETWGFWDTSGFSIATTALIYLREKFPGDYAKTIAMFPFAESILKREEMRIAAGEGPSQKGRGQKKARGNRGQAATA